METRIERYKKDRSWKEEYVESGKGGQRNKKCEDEKMGGRGGMSERVLGRALSFSTDEETWRIIFLWRHNWSRVGEEGVKVDSHAFICFVCDVRKHKRLSLDQ